MQHNRCLVPFGDIYRCRQLVDISIDKDIDAVGLTKHHQFVAIVASTPLPYQHTRRIAFLSQFLLHLDGVLGEDAASLFYRFRLCHPVDNQVLRHPESKLKQGLYATIANARHFLLTCCFVQFFPLFGFRSTAQTV